MKSRHIRRTSRHTRVEWIFICKMKSVTVYINSFVVHCRQRYEQFLKVYQARNLGKRHCAIHLLALLHNASYNRVITTSERDNRGSRDTCFFFFSMPLQQRRRAFLKTPSFARKFGWHVLKETRPFDFSRFSSITVVWALENGVRIAERSSEEAWTSADSILRRPIRRGGKRESYSKSSLSYPWQPVYAVSFSEFLISLSLSFSICHTLSVLLAPTSRISTRVYNLDRSPRDSELGCCQLVPRVVRESRVTLREAGPRPESTN